MTGTSPRWSTDTKRFVALVAIVLAGLAVIRFHFLLGPLAIALLLAYLFLPVVDHLERRWHFRRSIAAALLVAAMVALLALFLLLLVQQILAEFRSLNLDLEAIGARVEEWMSQPIVVGGVKVDVRALVDGLRDSISAVLQTAFSRVLDVGTDLAQGVVWLIFIVFATFYFMKDAARIGQWLADAMPPGFRDDYVDLRVRIAITWDRFFRGQLILAVTMGVVVGVTMWLIGLPNAFVIGVLFGVLEVVPNFGPVLASVPTVLIALFQGSTWMFPDNNVAFAAFVIAVNFALQQLEGYLLVPRILGYHLNLHPVAVLLAALAGASLFGILGILLASPVLATLREIGRYIAARMQDRDPFPPDVNASG